MKVCVVTNDLNNLRILVEYIKKINLKQYDVLTSNQQISKEFSEVQLFDEDFYNLLLEDSEQLVKYTHIIAINFSSVITDPLNDFQQVIQIDFDTGVILILNPQLIIVQYLPIQNIFFSENRDVISIQFEELINLFGYKKLKIVSAQSQSVQEDKQFNAFETIELSQSIDQNLLIHEFQLNTEQQQLLQNYEYKNAGYLNYQTSNENRHTSQFYYQSNQLVIIFCLYKLLTQKYDTVFEKYFLRNEADDTVSINQQFQLDIENNNYQQIIDQISPINSSSVQVNNIFNANPNYYQYLNVQQQYLNEFYNVINFNIDYQNTIQINTNKSTWVDSLYDTYVDEYHTCIVVSHPYNIYQCYLKCFEIVQLFNNVLQYLTTNENAYQLNKNVSKIMKKCEFLELFEKNFVLLTVCIALKVKHKNFILIALVQIFNQFVSQIFMEQQDQSFFTELKRENISIPTLIIQKNYISQYYEMLSNQQMRVVFQFNQLFQNEGDIIENLFANQDQYNQFIAQLSVQFNSQDTVYLNSNDLYLLTVLRAQNFNIQYDQQLFKRQLYTDPSYDLNFIIREFVSQIKQIVNIQRYQISIGNIFQLKELEHSPLNEIFINSGKFGQFKQNDYLDVFKETNQFLEFKQNKRLMVKENIQTIGQLLNLFKIKYQICVTSIMTLNNLFVFSQDDENDEIMGKQLFEFKDDNQFYKIFICDNDDGDEMPRVRFWW